MLQLTFDGGTLVLRGPVQQQLIDRLPGLVWDPRIENRRAPAFRHREIAAVVRDLGLPWVDESFFADLPDERTLSAPTTSLDPVELALACNAALVSSFLASALRVRILARGQIRAVVRPTLRGGTKWIGGDGSREAIYGDDGR